MSRRNSISKLTGPMAYIGQDIDGEWMLFRSWQDAVNTTGYPHFIPARPSEVYFAELAGRVIPKVREKPKLRIRE